MCVRSVGPPTKRRRATTTKKYINKYKTKTKTMEKMAKQ